jgi:glutathione S-transferase
MATMTESITLYGFGDSDRSGKVRWLARELGLEIEEKKVKLGEHRKPPYADLNPMKQIPTVIFRGETLIESTAACHLVAESFEEPKLWIGRGQPERRAYLFWISACAETLEGRLVESTLSKAGVLPETYFEIHERILRSKLRALVKMLPEDGYLCGDFTLADIVAAYSFRLAVNAEVVEWSDVESYLRRLADRPAARAARFFTSIEKRLG